MNAKQQPKAGLPAAIGAAVVALAAPFVAYEEGVVPYTYADPIGIPTQCAGETGPHVKFGQTFTVAQCMEMLDRRLWKEWTAFGPCIKRALELHQAVAVLSWEYNVGRKAACDSTLVRLLNQGAPPTEWCAQLPRWDKAKGRVLKGLTKRRAKEMRMCLGFSNVQDGSRSTSEWVPGGGKSTAPSAVMPRQHIPLHLRPRGLRWLRFLPPRSLSA